MAYEILNTCLLIPGISEGDCARWVQAWGSIIAIGFAAWVAGKEDRRRHREASALARLATPRVMLMAASLRGVTKEMSTNFSTIIKIDCDPHYFPLALSQLKQLPFPTDEQIQRIGFLDFSQELAEGLSAVESAITRLSFIDINQAKQDSAFRKKNAEFVYSALISADILLERSIIGYRKYVGEPKPKRGKGIILTPLMPLTFIESVKATITGCVARIKRKLFVRK